MPSFDDLERAVGRNMPNLPADVKKVQDWLRHWSDETSRKLHQQEQTFSNRLHEAIQQFQREVMSHFAPSGQIHPGDSTVCKLRHPPQTHVPTRQAPTRRGGPLPIFPPPGAPLVLPHRVGFRALSTDDYADAAKQLGCETRVIRAVALQEGKDHGFDALNRPVILWEPRHFAGYFRKAAPAYQKQYPELTHLKPKPHVYGLYNQQYTWLYEAYLINPLNALKAPSWGKFQILGESYHLAGFASVQLFVNAMCVSEQEQLKAFVGFIQGKHLEQALADKDWAAFATGYNGKNWPTRTFGPAGHPMNYVQSIEQHYNSIKD